MNYKCKICGQIINTTTCPYCGSGEENVVSLDKISNTIGHYRCLVCGKETEDGSVCSFCGSDRLYNLETNKVEQGNKLNNQYTESSFSTESNNNNVTEEDLNSNDDANNYENVDTNVDEFSDIDNLDEYQLEDRYLEKFDEILDLSSVDNVDLETYKSLLRFALKRGSKITNEEIAYTFSLDENSINNNSVEETNNIHEENSNEFNVEIDDEDKNENLEEDNSSIDTATNEEELLKQFKERVFDFDENVDDVNEQIEDEFLKALNSLNNEELSEINNEVSLNNDESQEAEEINNFNDETSEDNQEDEYLNIVNNGIDEDLKNEGNSFNDEYNNEALNEDSELQNYFASSNDYEEKNTGEEYVEIQPSQNTEYKEETTYGENEASISDFEENECCSHHEECTCQEDDDSCLESEECTCHEHECNCTHDEFDENNQECYCNEEECNCQNESENYFDNSECCDEEECCCHHEECNCHEHECCFDDYDDCCCNNHLRRYSEDPYYEDEDYHIDSSMQVDLDYHNYKLCKKDSYLANYKTVNNSNKIGNCLESGEKTLFYTLLLLEKYDENLIIYDLLKKVKAEYHLFNKKLNLEEEFLNNFKQYLDEAQIEDKNHDLVKLYKMLSIVFEEKND
ncbi:MAG: hypothetical protein ACTTID_00350 [Bacillales bacterium]